MRWESRLESELDLIFNGSGKPLKGFHERRELVCPLHEITGSCLG